jgi:hypothetical protein
MKKWKKRFIAMATALGFLPKVQAGTLTADEQRQIWAAYETKYGATFAADRQADEDDEEGDPGAPANDPSGDGSYLLSEQEQQELAALLPNGGTGAPAALPVTGRQANQALARQVATQQQTIAQLASEPEPDVPAGVVGTRSMHSGAARAIIMGHAPHTARHLFGNECGFMSRGPWWNEITATRREADLRNLSPHDMIAFRNAFNGYSDALAARSRHLAQTNALYGLDYEKLMAGTASCTDCTDLDAKFGEYTVRRQDIIIACFRSLLSVANIFPVQSNVRNREVVPAVSFGELSRGWRDGEFHEGFGDVRVLSCRMEGAAVRKAGIQYATKDGLKASGRRNQRLFTNFPATAPAPGATTVDGHENTVFPTGAKAGNFSGITAPWSPVAVGERIKLYAEPENYTSVVEGQTVTGTRKTGKSPG